MKQDPNTLYCSFCGKSQYEVYCMIAGPSVFICDTCTEICRDVVLQRKKEHDPKQITDAEKNEIEVQELRTLIDEAQRLLTHEVQISRQRTNPMEEVIAKIGAVRRPPQPENPQGIIGTVQIEPTT